MPYRCPSCKNDVKHKTNCICYDKCNKWFHLNCTKIRKNEFEIYCTENSFGWICENCSNDYCNKCEIIFHKKDNAISCDLCHKWLHLKCSGINKDLFKKLGDCDDVWYCTPCKNIIFPFNSTDNKKLISLTFNSIHNKEHVNKLRTLFIPNSVPKVSCLDYSHNCSVCTNLITNPRTLRSSIPCPSCKHLIHKKCSNLKPNQLENLKNTTNIWECPSCAKLKFPFTEIEDEEICLTSFNSNWTCNCGNQQPASSLNDKFNLKALFAKNDDSDNNFICTSNNEFDEQFDMNHTLKPDFKYYETHDFHSLKERVKNPFSLLHTNISSLQYNGDNLKLLLTNLEFKFDIIALSETWNPESKSHTFQPPIIEGYKEYYGTTGSSLKGGCGLYINEALKPLPRKDLNIKIKENDFEMETCWYEIIFEKQPNRLIGVVYRHPTRNDMKSIEAINSTLEKVKKRK